MTRRGRHADPDSKGFYRDLAVMIVGILLVGAAVFLLLYLLAGPGPDVVTVTTTSTTTTTEAPTTTAPTTTTVATTTTTVATTTTTVPVRPPEEVRVLVLNSVGIAGAAGRLSQELAEDGYQTLEPDDYQPEQDPSRIWYREGFSAEANVLLAYIPDALVEPLPDPGLGEGADVVIVLGTGYQE